jgi:hypothetical protein
VVHSAPGKEEGMNGRTGLMLGLGIVATLCSGCATQYMGTAASPASGKTYVVGSESNRATIWLCPTNGAACQRVEVEE